MKAEEFVLKIKSSAPQASDYSNKGLTEQFAKNAVNSFMIDRIKNNSIFRDELLRLIDCFDISKLKIGIVKFYDKVEIKSSYYLIGEVEADWLVIEKMTGLVRIIELYSQNDLWLGALNGSRFLEAMLTAKQFFLKRSFDDSLFDNQEITCFIAEQCAELAGGEQFIEFYKMLLGCFS